MLQDKKYRWQGQQRMTAWLSVGLRNSFCYTEAIPEVHIEKTAKKE
jgi:hypothetical protein